jgi:hypothetical protein
MENDKITFTVGQVVIAKHTGYLAGRSVKPPLEEGKHYPILNIIYDSKGNQHLDVGLTSRYNFIRSQETDEELPNGNIIHWCHPSRFELKK